MEARVLGNRFYLRRGYVISSQWDVDPVLTAMKSIPLEPRSVLEIGCADGWRLDAMHKHYGCEVCGVEPSDVAIAVGKTKYSSVDFVQSTADDLPKDKTFDVVIFGWCLYACERKDYFKIAYEADRVLEDGGHLIVYDFHPVVDCYKLNPDSSRKLTHKMDFSRMFTWHPCYKVRYFDVFPEANSDNGVDLMCAVLKKELK